MEPDPNFPGKRYSYYKSRGKMKLKEVFVTGENYLYIFLACDVKNSTQSREIRVRVKTVNQLFSSKFLWKI